jgi:endoglucanase
MMRQLLTSAVLLAASLASATVNYPFPQTAAYSSSDLVVSSSKTVSFTTTTNATYSSANKANALKGRFLEWMSNMYVESGNYARIKFDVSSYTVSEGIGYGMLLMVYFSDATTSYEPQFKKLWNYYDQRKNTNGLMNWKISDFSTSCSGNDCNGATDGDLDVALALIMGYYQFGNADFKTAAQTLLNDIYDHEVETNSTQAGYAGLLRPGDMWNSYYNPSYFSAGAIRVFKSFDSNNPSRWDAVLSKNYTMLKANMGSYNTGLVTDWCDKAGNPVNGNSTTMFKSDAVRTPWRIAMAASWFNDADANSYVTTVANWISSKVGTDTSKIFAEYYQNGNTTQGWTNSQYLGTFASALVSANVNQTLIDNIWVKMMQKSDDAGYFNASLRLLTGLFISGYMPNMAAGGVVVSSSSSVSSSSTVSSSSLSSSSLSSSSNKSSSSVSSSSVVSSSSQSSSSVYSSSSLSSSSNKSSSSQSSSSVSSSSSLSSSSAQGSSSSAAVSSSSATSAGVCIAYVAGAGGYKNNCYSSGLNSMQANTCYTQSASTNDVQWISDSAADTYWWTAVDCATGLAMTSSSSAGASSSSSSNSSSSSSSTTAIRDVALDLPLFSQVSGRQFDLHLSREGAVRVQVFGLTGRLETTLYNGALAAGSHSFSLQNLKGGMYLVRVQSALGSVSQTVFVRD